jgi:uncharacterized OB-fold protein
MQTIGSIPVADNLFHWTDGKSGLVGSHCKSCGAHYFPKCLSCRNPACIKKELTDVVFGQRGRLYSYTIQAYKPPPLFRMEPWSPYAIGLVELSEGLRVMGILTGCELLAIRIDMEVELCVEPLFRNEFGHDVLTYKFRPVDTAQSPA